MKVATTNTSPLGEPGFEYHQRPWGDLIYGTSDQLQRIGVMAFPPKDRDSRKRLKTTDPRGFAVTVTHFNENIYSARIPFPGREFYDEPDPRPFAPGVTFREHRCADKYAGSADALVAAGLVPLGYFPGYPGMRKTIVTVLPNGSLPKGAPTANCSDAKEPGAKWITCASKGKKPTYQVSVVVPDDKSERRREAYKIAEHEWEARMLSLPRPAPLVDLPDPIGKPVKAKSTPKYRADGNVLYLLPKSAQ